MDKSGGNLGVGLAYEAARHDIGVDLVIGLGFSRTKRALCEHYGARIIHDDWLRDGMSPKEVVAQCLKTQPERYFFSDQFANQANLEAHLNETGPEFADQIAQVLASGKRRRDRRQFPRHRNTIARTFQRDVISIGHAARM